MDTWQRVIQAFPNSPLGDCLLVQAWIVVAAALVAAGLVLVGHYGRSTDLPADAQPAHRGWPRRRHYLLGALCFTGLAVYGSLVPLRFEALTMADAVGRFLEIRYRSIGVDGRADWVANILLFIPLGYLWLAACTADRRGATVRLAAALAVLLACSLFSMALEFAQLYFPRRTVSQNDILAETIGGAIGVALWLSCGDTLTDWFRGYTAHQRGKRPLDWLLEAYFIGFVLYCVLPLDLTISVTEIVRKYRAGKVQLIPFADATLSFGYLYSVFRDTIVYVPVGMLVASWRTPQQRPLRSLVTCLLLGGLLTAALEAAQLLVVSRFTTTEDILLGTLGILIGAFLMHRLRQGESQIVDSIFTGGMRVSWISLAIAVLYAGGLVVIFCAPFELIRDEELWKDRFVGFLHVPFARLYTGSEYNAISEVLRKILFYVPLGTLFAIAAANLPTGAGVRRVAAAFLLLVAAAIATAIEMLQVFIADHVPDVTDVILCSGGALLGMLITAGFMRRGTYSLADASD